MNDLNEKALALLRKSLDDPKADFRPGQYEAIQALTQQKAQLLVVQRTGWGKSSVYFLTARLLREQGAGPALLISPLLALMRNQIAAAARIGVRAATLNSSNQEEWAEIERKIQADQIDVLLVSPEKLASDDFRQNVLLPIADRIGFFIVDEAHCISDWGHDFRPDYQRITRVLQSLPGNIPVLATTATANNRVVSDITAQLGPHLQISRGPLTRESLSLQNIEMPGQASRLAWLAEQVPKLAGSGIIYTLTVRDADRVAQWLRLQNVNARAYHSDLAPEVREDLEHSLLGNTVKALVATTALGMGFDKPDLGFVIHYQRPGSVVHYYQQVGRAGRALEQAYGVLFSGKEDSRITEYFLRTAFPPDAHVDGVLAVLHQAEDGLSSVSLEAQINLGRGQIQKVLKSLEVRSPAPVVKRDGRWYVTPVRYIPDQERILRLMQVRRDEQEKMQQYAQSQTCLMQFLSLELDDPNPAPCGKCAVCQKRLLLPDTVSIALVEKASQFLRRCDQPVFPRKKWADNRAIPKAQQSQEGRALCLWGDDGWGESVRRGKQEDKRFDDQLVLAIVEMIRHRWKPSPEPQWVACVPSLNHSDLVVSFARRVAANLNLPFINCIEKVRQTPPQKEMQNSHQQAHNIEGAFALNGEKVRSGPVLLLDDMVDSRWTLTMIASLLLQAGSGPVFPLVLAMTTKSDE